MRACSSAIFLAFSSSPPGSPAGVADADAAVADAGPSVGAGALAGAEAASETPLFFSRAAAIRA